MLRTLAQLLIVPPVNLVIMTLVALILVPRWPRLGRNVGLTCVVALLLLGTPLVSGTLLTALDVDLPVIPPEGEPPQAIIVLGGDTMRTPDPRHRVQISSLTLERLRTAAALQRRTDLPILVSGGKVDRLGRPLAELMADSLRDDFNVPVRWTEDHSANTWQNAEYSAKILLPEGIRSVYVVTNAWHMRRALIAFEPTGLIVTAAPTPSKWVTWPDIGDLIPQASGWQESYYAFHEWIGGLWYEAQ